MALVNDFDIVDGREMCRLDGRNPTRRPSRRRMCCGTAIVDGIASS